MQKKPVLSISLLVSDRPDTIQRCLDSLNTIRENITSELIIVNTSHSENVRAIIETKTIRKVALCIYPPGLFRGKERTF